jgi:thymidylate kinase
VLTWYFSKRGFIVLFDRHYYFDYFEWDIAPTAGRRPLTRRMHGVFLKRLYHRPGLVICLDAPAEVLYRRKQEASIELLEARRREYLKFQSWIQPFHVINAEQHEDDVVAEVTAIIRENYGSVHRREPKTSIAHFKP